MKKKEIIKKSIDFDNIIKNGKKTENSYFALFYLPNNLDETKFGFAISKKNASAVERNKAKRQTKEIVDDNKFLFSNGQNYIIMIKKRFFLLKYLEKEKELLELIEKVKNEK